MVTATNVFPDSRSRARTPVVIMLAAAFECARPKSDSSGRTAHARTSCIVFTDFQCFSTFTCLLRTTARVMFTSSTRPIIAFTIQVGPVKRYRYVHVLSADRFKTVRSESNTLQPFSRVRYRCLRCNLVRNFFSLAVTAVDVDCLNAFNLPMIDNTFNSYTQTLPQLQVLLWDFVKSWTFSLSFLWLFKHYPGIIHTITF